MPKVTDLGDSFVTDAATAEQRSKALDRVLSLIAALLVVAIIRVARS